MYRENNGKLFGKDEAISNEKFKRIFHANETMIYYRYFLNITHGPAIPS